MSLITSHWSWEGVNLLGPLLRLFSDGKQVSPSHARHETSPISGSLLPGVLCSEVRKGALLKSCRHHGCLGSLLKVRGGKG